ncbi:Myb-like DNA-binding domain protein [Podila epigama]|nr:Myb-like DNA-binding domain protein [Podila epigama]
MASESDDQSLVPTRQSELQEALSDQSDDDDEEEEELVIDDEDLDSFLREHNALDENGDVITDEPTTISSKAPPAAGTESVSTSIPMASLDIYGTSFGGHDAQGTNVSAPQPYEQQQQHYPTSFESMSSDLGSSSSNSIIVNNNNGTGDMNVPSTAATIPVQQEQPFDLLLDAENWMSLMQKQQEEEVRDKDARTVMDSQGAISLLPMTEVSQSTVDKMILDLTRNFVRDATTALPTSDTAEKGPTLLPSTQQSNNLLSPLSESTQQPILRHDSTSSSSRSTTFLVPQPALPFTSLTSADSDTSLTEGHPAPQLQPQLSLPGTSLITTAETAVVTNGEPLSLPPPPPSSSSSSSSASASAVVVPPTSQNALELNPQAPFVPEHEYVPQHGEEEQEEEEDDEEDDGDEGEEGSTSKQDMTLERLEELSSQIKTQTIQALQANRTFQETILRNLITVQQAQSRNKAMQAEFKAMMEKHERMRTEPVVLKSSGSRLGPPYFIDAAKEVPPDNPDTLKRKERALGLTARLSAWGSKEKENLRAGVIAENKRLLYEMLVKSGNYAALKQLETIPEDELTINTKGLDWERISVRYVQTRTPTQCLIQWTGHDHPGINKGAWRKKEIVRLEELVEKHQARDWIKIALDLDTNRTASQCFRRHQSRQGKTISRAPWTEEENNILREAVRVLGDNNWGQISYCLDNRSAAQCHKHWVKSISHTIRRGRWLPEEDMALIKGVELLGTRKWNKLQHYVPGRTDIQCRERYMNVLSPGLRTGSWSKEESEKLTRMVREYGVGKWAAIAAQMDGRTDNQCARRWQLMTREIRSKGKSKYIIRRKHALTTTASIPNGEEHMEAIRKVEMKHQLQLQRRQRKQEREAEKLSILIRLQKNRQRVEYLNSQEMYEGHLRWQRRIYDLWVRRWGHEIDPIERVFNLGIPPERQDKEKEKEKEKEKTLQVSGLQVSTQLIGALGLDSTELHKNTAGESSQVNEVHSHQAQQQPEQQEQEQYRQQEKSTPETAHQTERSKQKRRLDRIQESEMSVIKEYVPGSNARPGMVRPVPPSVATAEALLHVIDQGRLGNNRFVFPHRTKGAEVETVPLESKPLTAEERSQPEYQELFERFEAVFMWPMLLGMLNMDQTRKMVAENLLRVKENILKSNAAAAAATEVGAAEPSSGSTSKKRRRRHVSKTLHESYSLQTESSRKDHDHEQDQDQEHEDEEGDEEGDEEEDEEDEDDDEDTDDGYEEGEPLSRKRIRTDDHASSSALEALDDEETDDMSDVTVSDDEMMVHASKAQPGNKGKAKAL